MVEPDLIEDVPTTLPFSSDHRIAGVVHDVERARRHRLHAGRDADRHCVHLDAVGGEEALSGGDDAGPGRGSRRDLAERDFGGGARELSTRCEREHDDTDRQYNSQPQTHR